MPVKGLRRLRARLGADGRADRGAVAMLVALLLGSGVLLGMAALVVDVGNIYVERTQLQSGADAGAVKVAQTCATDPACARTAAAVARKYANANSNDNRSRVSVVCGRGGGLAACPAPARGLADCVNAAPATGDYVEVRTSTLQADGSTLLPPAFAAAVSGYRGTTFTACSRASWGAPTTGRLALTISACEWNRYTLGGARFPDPPVEQLIYLHDDPAAGTCRPPGQPADIPGGFGTLASPGNDCRTPVALSGIYNGDSGRGVSAHCRAVLADARTNGRPLLVPIFGPVGSHGAAPRYTMVGFAAFMVTGWDLPGSAARSTLTGRSTCPSSTTCILGYFTRATVPGGGPTGGPDLGAYTVGLVG